MLLQRQGRILVSQHTNPPISKLLLASHVDDWQSGRVRRGGHGGGRDGGQLGELVIQLLANGVRLLLRATVLLLRVRLRPPPIAACAMSPTVHTRPAVERERGAQWPAQRVAQRGKGWTRVLWAASSWAASEAASAL